MCICITGIHNTHTTRIINLYISHIPRLHTRTRTVRTHAPALSHAPTLTHSLIYPLTHSLTHSFTHSHTHTHLCTHACIRLCICGVYVCKVYMLICASCLTESVHVWYVCMYVYMYSIFM